MPAEHQHSTRTDRDDRPRYPDLKAEYGEDPARFLWSRDGDVPMLAIARIRGIDDSDLLDAYQRVEVEIGPRRSAIAAINRRQDQLEDRDEEAAETAEVSA